MHEGEGQGVVQSGLGGQAETDLVLLAGTGRSDLDVGGQDRRELRATTAAVARDLTAGTLAVSAADASGEVARSLVQVADVRNTIADHAHATCVDVRETADGLTVHPRPLHGGVFRTYADHRLAQTAAVLGLVVDGVEIEDVATTAKTVPDFTGLWDRMLGRTR